MYAISAAGQHRFQSTCPRGARRGVAYATGTLTISIHVPTRGTTPNEARNGVFSISIHVPTRGTTTSDAIDTAAGKFQSTCPRGARLPPCFLGIWSIFQSTCPRGARPNIGIPPRFFEDFNPRAHEGHDLLVRLWVREHNVFQSTCPRGARLYPIIV